jgi:hypothetical protein
MKLSQSKISLLKSELENHSLLVTDVIQTQDDLKLFMTNHIFAVWDFMTLAKNVQHSIVPSGGIWIPGSNNRSEAARLINEIILCEETDEAPDTGYMSHFDLYLMAMLEVGADISHITKFIDNIKKTGNPVYSDFESVVSPALKFVRHTLGTLEKGPHCVAASFCYGREDVIPGMFTRIVNQLDITNIDAPKFHYYLDRHIEVDGDHHGDASKRIVEILCEDDPKKIHEAENAACDAIKARMQFFDEIERLILRG